MIDTATIERYMRDANPIPHVDDLDPDEFARFVAAANTRRGAIMQAPTHHETTEPHPTTPQPPRSRMAWAFAAAFILILAVIGIAALALRNNNPPATDEPAETPEQPTSVESLTWYRVPLEDDGFLRGLSDITVGGPGLVAVATTGSSRGGTYFPAVWTSTDGYAWTRVPHDEAVFGVDSEMTAVAALGTGLVAVGMEHIWTSPDGYTWSRVPHDPTVDLEGVVAGGPALLAFGGSDDSSNGLWTSPDGYTWTQVPHDEAVFTHSGINSITRGGPGWVAVGVNGTEWDEPAMTFPAVWTSLDGYTWTRVPHDPSVFSEGTYMAEVAAGPSGLVAVGGERRHDAGPIAAVWTSPDGVSWTRVPHDEATFGGGYEDMASVAAVGDGFVAVGGWGGLRAWTSPDGFTWTRISETTSAFSNGAWMGKVIAGGPGVVILGGMGGNRTAIWVATPSDADEPAPPPASADFSVGWQ